MKPTETESNGKGPQRAGLFIRLCLLPAFLALVCNGCKQEPKTVAETKTVAAAIDPVGTYALATINGNAVPYTIQHEGHTMTIKSGSFIIKPDGTCSSKMLLEGREAAIEVAATYTLNGKTLTMKWQGAGSTVGSVEGNTFTMENEGMKLAYKK